jgi:hypothetical protein
LVRPVTLQEVAVDVFAVAAAHVPLATSAKGPLAEVEIWML